MNRLTKITSKWTPIAALAMGLWLGAGCSDDDVATTLATSCNFDDECQLGEVCITKDGVCGSVSCDFCLMGQVCYTPPGGGAASCSRPECTLSTDCGSGQVCEGRLCKTPTVATCSSPADCDPGQTCNLISGRCEQSEETCTTETDCGAGQVCDDGQCVNAATCTDDSVCTAGEYCDTQDNVCKTGCRTESCEADQLCNETSRTCVCQPSLCAAGATCNQETQRCETPTTGSCADASCEDGQVCDPDTLQCVAPMANCTMDTECPGTQVCDLSSGMGTCTEPMACANGRTQADCDGTSSPFLNTEFCECVECVTSTQCPNNEMCNLNGECQPQCATPCDQATPGTCGQGTPYCYAGCCVECIGAADCSAGQVCIDGFCGDQPDCSVDPTLCPNGYTCQQGTCQPAPSGGQCSVNDPNSCPFGQVCQPSSQTSQTGTCTSSGVGGGNGCGGCNADCTCDGGLSCDPALLTCSGCSGGLDPRCGGFLPICLGGLCIGNLLGL